MVLFSLLQQNLDNSPVRTVNKQCEHSLFQESFIGAREFLFKA
ncbi:366_t:CDS:1, partial [Gigaspora margarita]